MHLILLAAVGEGGVRVGHVDRADLGETEDDAVVRVPGAGLRGAGVIGRLDHLLRAVVHLRHHVDERRVDRLGGRGAQRHRTVLLIELVADRLGLAPRGEGVALEGGVEGEAVAQAGDQAERLEGRAGHPGGGCPVAGVLDEVVAAVQGDQLTVGGVDRSDRGVHRRGLRAARPRGRIGLGLVGLRGLLRRRLALLVEGGRHPQAAAVDLRIGEAQRGELLLGHVHQEALRALVARVHHDRRQVRQLAGELVVLVLGDGLLVEHAGQHVLVAGLEPRHVVGVDLRVEDARVLHHRGEDRRLADAEVLRIDAEPRLRRGLHTVRTPTEVDGVEVVGEDLLLAQPIAQLEREDDLLHLAGDRLLRRQVHQLDVLLGDRRAALHILAGRDRDERTQHAHRRDARVGPERPVLGRHLGVLHRLRDLVVRQARPVLHRQIGQLRRTVAVVEVGGVGLEVRVRIGHLRGRVEPGERDAADQHDREDARDQNREDLLPEGHPPPPRRLRGGSSAGTTCRGSRLRGLVIHGCPRRSAADPVMARHLHVRQDGLLLVDTVPLGVQNRSAPQPDRTTP
ncbi:hypothetical protein SDC9_75226 [bioreactor metagenome]|uniref:NAD-specific glutamate dehydrogenase n=1 Tax=bioreactor metagenome TaxID=1076179 RepID=A0A644YK48_9ZZZZ